VVTVNPWRMKKMPDSYTVNNLGVAPTSDADMLPCLQDTPYESCLDSWVPQSSWKPAAPSAARNRYITSGHLSPSTNSRSIGPGGHHKDPWVASLILEPGPSPTIPMTSRQTAVCPRSRTTAPSNRRKGSYARRLHKRWIPPVCQLTPMK